MSVAGRELDHREAAVLDDGADLSADMQLGPSTATGEGDDLGDSLAGLGDVGAGGVLGEAHDDEPCERGGQLAQAADGDAVTLGELVAYEAIEQLGLLAQQGGGSEHVRLRGWVDGGEGGQKSYTHARARVARVVVAFVIAPLQPAVLAVGGGLLAGEAEQRTDQPSLAGDHAEQGAPAWGGGEAIEDRLDLIAGGVARGDETVALEREALGLAVAQLPRPPLPVAPALLDWAGGGGSLHADHLDGDAELLAEGGTVALLLLGAAAQPIVDMQSGDVVGAAEGNGDVEQADRISAAREHGDDGAIAREQPSGADKLAELLVEHRVASPCWRR